LYTYISTISIISLQTIAYLLNLFHDYPVEAVSRTEPLRPFFIQQIFGLVCKSVIAYLNMLIKS